MDRISYIEEPNANTTPAFECYCSMPGHRANKFIPFVFRMCENQNNGNAIRLGSTVMRGWHPSERFDY